MKMVALGDFVRNSEKHGPVKIAFNGKVYLRKSSRWKRVRGEHAARIKEDVLAEVALMSETVMVESI